MCKNPIGTAFKACVHNNTINVKGVKIPCGSWACPECAERKKIMLGNRVKGGFENEKIRFATLTARSCGSLATQIKSLKVAWNRLRLWLTRHCGLSKFFWVLEFGTEKGRPHLHVLLNCFVKQRTLSRVAYASGFGRIVDIRIVRDGGGFGYVYKYLGKDCGSKLGATVLRLIHGRRFGTSRNIKAPETRKDGVYNLGFFKDVLSREFAQEGAKAFVYAFTAGPDKQKLSNSVTECEGALICPQDQAEELLAWFRDGVIGRDELLEMAGHAPTDNIQGHLIAMEFRHGWVHEVEPF